MELRARVPLLNLIPAILSQRRFDVEENYLAVYDSAKKPIDIFSGLRQAPFLHAPLNL